MAKIKAAKKEIGQVEGEGEELKKLDPKEQAEKELYMALKA